MRNILFASIQFMLMKGLQTIALDVLLLNQEEKSEDKDQKHIKDHVRFSAQKITFSITGTLMQIWKSANIIVFNNKKDNQKIKHGGK